MEKPIAKSRRETLDKPFDPETMIKRLRELLEKHNESYREASLRAGLDHQGVRRILDGQRPSMHICILMADHFGINPNEFLTLAGWPALKAFNIGSIDKDNLPPEAVDVALAISKISDPGTRKDVTAAILTLVRKYIEE
ncbi:MAG: helix-turn-helix transcriptional regulator [Chloroflexi bacterium]|nr:helix-turn-helix transcriptional regulator [Chloroflexota bacterium]